MATTNITPPPAATEAESKELETSETSPVTPARVTYGCQHVKALLQAARQQAIDEYTKIAQAINNSNGSVGRTYKSSTGVVTTAQATYICLQCSNVTNVRERHRKDHPFSVDSSNGYLFCHDCKDFVYDPTFEEIRSGNRKKRKHAALDPDDRKLVEVHTGATPCAATGLRGLYNMGQTCFMSVILQSLVHNPLIRAFYLSEGHRSPECEREACTSCALDDIFTEFFGQEKHEGYGAVHMLQGCWKGGGGLAGYSQQDAHEYLGFILNSLHTANTEYDDDNDEDSNTKKKSDSKDCDCVVHQTFGGLLKSTVTCTTCKTTNHTLDPFMDLSLDIRATNISVKKKKQPLTNGTTTIKEVIPMDLGECLDRFTSPETLSSDSYTCNECHAQREARKKLSLARLPPVMPIHLKRFSHSKSAQTSNKVDTKIRFPFTLNLAAYLAKPKPPIKLKKGRASNGNADEDKDEQDDGGDKNAAATTGALSSPLYDLSAVVVHKGKIDNGHYISYSRQGDEWFRFDDSMVVQVDEKEVLGAEAYMLFYTAQEFEVVV